MVYIAKYGRHMLIISVFGRQGKEASYKFEVRLYSKFQASKGYVIGRSFQY